MNVEDSSKDFMGDAAFRPYLSSRFDLIFGIRFYLIAHKRSTPSNTTPGPIQTEGSIG